MIGHLDLENVRSPYRFALMIPQNETERVLEDRLEAFGVRPELGVELTGFTQADDGVSAVLRHADGRVETAAFAWMIGCDGAHSTVRHQLGFAFPGEAMGTDWILGDFHMTGSPFPETELATYWHEDGVIVFFPMGFGRYRMIADVGPSSGEKPATPSVEQFQAIVDRRGPGGIRLTDTIWTSAFRINERQVGDYRSGRVFLAGDAAHVHSPAGGQGMNTGMQDVLNLAWKLALVCRGTAAAPALLDSYTIERRAIGAQVIGSAGRLTKAATLRNHAVQHVRNFVAHLMLGLAPVRENLAHSFTELSVKYEESPLNGPSHGRLSAGDRVAPAGGESPYGAGDTPRFCLRAADEGGAAVARRYPALVEATIRPATSTSGIELVRPDGYLALSARAGDWASVVEYLDRLAGGDAAASAITAGR